MRSSIIKLRRSIIPSCDVDSLKKLRELVTATHDVEGVGGYKIGFELVILAGMNEVVKTIREVSNLPVIYDHQKAGTDIPEMGSHFMNACKRSGADAVIIFPQAGPQTERAWIAAAQKARLPIIVGGEMTHEGYLQQDGGFIGDDAPIKIYELAGSLGVTDFVVPGNKPFKIEFYRKFLEARKISPVFYSPGLIAQNGDITASAKAAGDNWHAIIGRGIYQAKDMRKAAQIYVKALSL